MVNLKDLTWFHFVDFNKSKASLTSTTHSRSSSVPDQVLYGQAHPQRIETFDGPVRSVSVVRRRVASIVVPFSAELESTPRSSISKTSVTMAGPSRPAEYTTAEEQAMFKPYAQLPTPPEGSGEDIGVDINPHFPPDPSTASFDCSVCDHATLPSLPDSPLNTPLGFAQFGFISRESFNTNVKGLIQDEPDTPIGGYFAAPMNTSVRGVQDQPPAAVEGYFAAPLHTRISAVMKGKGRGHLDGGDSSIEVPQIQVTSPPLSSCSNVAPVRQPLIPRSSFSNPFSSKEKGKQPQKATDSDVDDSEYVTAVVTAHDTPARQENSEMGHDGARASTTENDNRNDESNLPLPDCCVSPTDNGSETTEILVYDLNGYPKAGVKPYGQTSFGLSKSGNLPNTGYGLNGNVPYTSAGISRTDFANRPGVDAPGFSAPGLNAPMIPAAGLPNPDLRASMLQLPVDVTGELPVPLTPKKLTKKQKAKGKGQKGVRKLRRIVIRRRVLVLILGRQLAGPTKDALKLISQGTPVPADVGGVTEAAGLPAPDAPVPVPGGVDGGVDSIPRSPPLPPPM